MANVEIANTIKSQIQAIDKMALWAWGSTNYFAGENYLAFKVRGLKLKGFVKIILDEASDLYNIEFYKGLSKPKEFKTITGIYADELVDKIDGIIEK